MPSVFVVGASRGIGLALTKQLAADPANQVVALVRNKESTLVRFKEEIPNYEKIHLVASDVTDDASLKVDFPGRVVREVSKITGGKLDLVIGIAAVGDRSFDYIGEQIEKDINSYDSDMLWCFKTNVLGTSHLIEFCMPLVKAGTGKKVFVISSAAGDPNWVAEWEVFFQSAYAVSKAGLNMVIAKFHAQYKQDGIIVGAISPGIVDTEFPGLTDTSIPNVQKGNEHMAKVLSTYAPDWKGPIQPAESAEKILHVIQAATLDHNGGRMVSHNNDGNWL